MSIDRAAFERCILDGGVALFPADTVYGLACDPLNPAAFGRLNALKGRDPEKPVAVMYFDPLMMRELLGDLGPRTGDAVGRLLPGPVTLVLPNPAGRYPLACGADTSTLGVRLIEGPLAGAGCVAAQSSANLAGEPPPRRVEDVEATILEGADEVLDGGELPGSASTVIDLSSYEDGDFRVLREGAVSAAEVAATLGT